MTAWAVTSIRNRFPNARITWLVESRCAAIAEASSARDVLSVPRDRWKQNRGSVRVWREQVSFYLALRNMHFDFGFDFQGHAKTALALRLAYPKVRRSARATDSLARALNPPIPFLAGEHTVARNHRLLCSAENFTLTDRPELTVLPPHSDFPTRPVASISTGAGHPSKAYPADMWRQVGLLLQIEGWKVVFLGGPTDPKISLSHAVDWVDRLPLSDTLAAVAASDLHFASDTGTGHMAAAVGVPVISIFGPTHPTEFRPYTNRGVVLQNGMNPAQVMPDEVVAAGLELVRKNYAQVPH